MRDNLKQTKYFLLRRIYSSILSTDLIKTIEDLLESGRGNKSELEHILMLLRANRQLPRFDQKYLETLLIKKSINYRGSDQYKSEGTTLVLSLLFGLFGFMGFGHRYVGHIAKSLAILYSGWALMFFNFLIFYPFIHSIMNPNFDYHSSSSSLFSGLTNLLHLDPQSSFTVTSIITIDFPFVYFVLYVWQIWDARRVTREFNRYMDETGTQLYEITIEKKITFVLITLAPIITGVICTLITNPNLVIRSISILH